MGHGIFNESIFNERIFNTHSSKIGHGFPLGPIETIKEREERKRVVERSTFELVLFNRPVIKSAFMMKMDSIPHLVQYKRRKWKTFWVQALLKTPIQSQRIRATMLSAMSINVNLSSRITTHLKAKPILSQPFRNALFRKTVFAKANHGLNIIKMAMRDVTFPSVRKPDTPKPNIPFKTVHASQEINDEPWPKDDPEYIKAEFKPLRILYKPIQYSPFRKTLYAKTMHGIHLMRMALKLGEDMEFESFEFNEKASEWRGTKQYDNAAKILTFSHSSSFVGQVVYEKTDQSMLIVLGDSIYNFCSVPRDIYDSFRTASSKGRFFNSSIKGVWDC